MEVEADADLTQVGADAVLSNADRLRSHLKPNGLANALLAVWLKSVPSEAQASLLAAAKSFDQPKEPLMGKARISRIDLQGFRSFGQSAQGFDVPDSLAVLWGGNSQGKSSLAEAIEFLFSGQIARRELMAGSKDEFAEALRNAHIAPHCVTSVQADIICSDGKVRQLCRTLKEDYKKGSSEGCASILTIDGDVCEEGAIESILGIRLSHPPLSAPVLAQHTLAYVFSAPPAERAAYFRAMLDTQDLEDFRSSVARLADVLPAPQSQALDKLAVVEAMPSLAATVLKIRKAKTEDDLKKQLTTNIATLLTSVGLTPTGKLDDDASSLSEELRRRRAQAFPLELMTCAPSVPVVAVSSDTTAKIELFLVEREKVDVESKKLLALFNATLALEFHEHADNLDCPLCGTAGSLTAERLTFIRGQVAATTAYQNANSAFLAAVRALDGQLDASFGSVRNALPQFIRTASTERKKLGFRFERLRELVNNEEIVDQWMAALRPLLLTCSKLRACIGGLRAHLRQAIDTPDIWADWNDLKSAFGLTLEAQNELVSHVQSFALASGALFEPLKAAVDQSTLTDGWETLLACAQSPVELLSAVEASKAHVARLKLLKAAVDEIDIANGKVLDEKFADLSEGVRVWWNRLRPDEPTFFESVQRRSVKTRRTVDLRVGLAANEDRSDAKIRDAISVLSQSQLHCLGLSLFLARAVHEGAGFIVLDDPVLTSDDDYRPNFASSVIEGLLDGGIQVIVATQDHSTWKDIGHRWSHRNASLLQLIRNDAREGTEIRNQTDDLATMIAKAQPYTKSQDPVQRKEGAILVRQAIERFGKVMLVKARKANGDNLASITDYDGQNFGNFSAQVQILLVKDNSHPGKLVAAHNYVTPGPHDDTPPSSGELKTAFGDLKRLKKDYLE